MRSSRRPTRRCRSSRRASSPGSVMPWAARDPGSTTRPSPTTPRWPSACSNESARRTALLARLQARDRVPTKDWFGMPENAVRAVLEAFTVTGVTGLARRDGNLRYYDLLERLLPAELLGTRCRSETAPAQAAVPVPRARPARRRRRSGGAFARIAEPSVRNELREELVAVGALVPVDVEGVVASAWSSRRSSRCWRRRRSRRPPSPSSHRSTRCSGTPSFSRACSPTTTCGRASFRRQSAVGAITCSR